MLNIDAFLPQIKGVNLVADTVCVILFSPEKLIMPKFAVIVCLLVVLILWLRYAKTIKTGCSWGPSSGKRNYYFSV